MGIKRKNQPGYVKAKGKDGRTIWVPESKVKGNEKADLKQIKSDFSTIKPQQDHEEIREEFLDALEDYNDAYAKRYAHLNGSNYHNMGIFEMYIESLHEQEEKGVVLDNGEWNHDASIISEMAQILSQDEIHEEDKERVRQLHSTLYPFKAIRKPGVYSTEDKFTPGNERMIIDLVARELLQDANAQHHSQEFLDEKQKETVKRSERMINAGGSFEELYDLEDTLFEDTGRTHYYGEGTKEYLNAAINSLIEKDKEDIDREHDEKYQSTDFMDPYDRARSVIIEAPNMYLASVFPEKYLAKKLEQYNIDGVYVSPFQNGREYGNVYTVLEPDGTPISFSVYEHRNSDSIIINGKRYWDGEELPYAADNKNAFFAEFSHYDFEQAADALAMYMKDAQNGELATEQYLVETAQHRDWNSILAQSLGKAYTDFLEKYSPEEAQRIKRNSDEDVLKRLDFDPEFDDE